MTISFYPGHNPGFNNAYQMIEVFPTFIALAETNWQSNVVNTRAINIPAGLPGDRLLMLLFKYGDTSNPSTPSGWSSVSGVGGTTATARWRAFTRIDPGSGGGTVNVSGIGTDNNHGVVMCLRFRNSDACFGADVAINLEFGGASSSNPPNLDIGAVRMVQWVAWAGNMVDDLYTSGPSGYSGFETGGDGAFVAGDARTACARRNLQAASTNPGAFTQEGGSSPDVGVAATFAIVGTFVPQ